MYTVMTDSCCDLNKQVAARYEHFEILSLSYTIADETIEDTALTREEVKAYYDRLRAGETCMTSQIPPEKFYQAFCAHAKRGEAVLYIGFSSALSGTYNSACIAREMVLEEYPDAVIEVADSLSASAGQGMMVCDALDRRDNGMEIGENARWIRENAQRYAAWFTVDDLNFLKRGGRCSPSAAFFGTLLSVKPVLHVSSEGRLIAKEKVRGRKQALRALAEKFGRQEADPAQEIFISHGDCEDDALALRRMLADMYGIDPDRVILSCVGPVIGSHSGPGTVAFFYRGKDRE